MFPFAVTRTVAVAIPVEKVSVDPEVPTPAEPVKWLTLSGFDYGGNDMTGSPFTKSTQDECIDLCKETSGCAACLYAPSSKKCWLKSKLGVATRNADLALSVPPVPTSSSVSSWNKHLNEDHAGGDIACYTDGTMVDKCAALCAAHRDCKSYNEVSPLVGGGWSQGGCCVKTSDIIPYE